MEPEPRPGALLDAVFFVAAGYYGARRTSRLATGVVNAGALGLIDFALFAIYAMVSVPGLLTGIWKKPFILVIGSTFLAIAVTFAVALGALGAVGGWSTAKLAR